MAKVRTCGAGGGAVRGVAPRPCLAAGRVAGRRSLAPARAAEDDSEKYDEFEGRPGFKGGEVGLKNFAEDIKKAGVPKKKKFFKGQENPEAIGKGKDKIYVGNETYVKDDARLYPGKEDVGFFSGATGGFAGGEVGLKRFAADGDIDIREDDSNARRQPPSPLTVAFGLGGVAAVGSLILDLPDEVDLQSLSSSSLSEIQQTAQAAGVDSNWFVFSLAAGAALVGGATIYGAAKKATKNAVEAAKETGTKVVFGLVVLKAAEFILKN